MLSNSHVDHPHEQGAWPISTSHGSHSEGCHLIVSHPAEHSILSYDTNLRLLIGGCPVGVDAI
jgi:hypothetical protein